MSLMRYSSTIAPNMAVMMAPIGPRRLKAQAAAGAGHDGELQPADLLPLGCHSTFQTSSLSNDSPFRKARDQGGDWTHRMPKATRDRWASCRRQSSRTESLQRHWDPLAALRSSDVGAESFRSR